MKKGELNKGDSPTGRRGKEHRCNPGDDTFTRREVDIRVIIRGESETDANIGNIIE